MTEWRTIRLADICSEGGGFIRTGPFGSQLHQSDYVDNIDGIPVVMPKDMSDGRLDLRSIARIDQITANRLTKHLLKDGDIVLSRRGDVGRSAWITSKDLPVLCGTGSIRICPGSPKSVIPDYLRYYFRSQLARDYLEGQAVGATMPNLNAVIVSRMPIPLLPLSQQLLAAEILSNLDMLIENHRRRIELLEEMARSIYREWFVNFRYPGDENDSLVDSQLGPIPDGWRVSSCGEIAEIIMGQSPKSSYYNTDGIGRPFHQGVTDFGLHFPTHRKYCSIDLRLADKGDILISVRAPVGRLNVADTKLVIGRGLAAVKAKDGCQALLLSQLKEVFAEEDSMGSGTIFKAITKNELERINILYPSQGLAKAANERLFTLSEMIRSLTFTNRQLASLRDLLLPKLVTGQIDVSKLDLDALVEESLA